jgi:hypothetical protein
MSKVEAPPPEEQAPTSGLGLSPELEAKGLKLREILNEDPVCRLEHEYHDLHHDCPPKRPRDLWLRQHRRLICEAYHDINHPITRRIWKWLCEVYPNEPNEEEEWGEELTPNEVQARELITKWNERGTVDEDEFIILNESLIRAVQPLGHIRFVNHYSQFGFDELLQFWKTRLDELKAPPPRRTTAWKEERARELIAQWNEWLTTDETEDEFILVHELSINALCPLGIGLKVQHYDHEIDFDELIQIWKTRLEELRIIAGVTK